MLMPLGTDQRIRFTYFLVEKRQALSRKLRKRLLVLRTELNRQPQCYEHCELPLLYAFVRSSPLGATRLPMDQIPFVRVAGAVFQPNALPLSYDLPAEISRSRTLRPIGSMVCMLEPLGTIVIGYSVVRDC